MEALEELYFDPDSSETPSPLGGDVREALDTAFAHNEVEDIVAKLVEYAQSDSTTVSNWATTTLQAMEERSPTSLKVALKAIRKGKNMNLLSALEMELNIAAAFCVRRLPMCPPVPVHRYPRYFYSHSGLHMYPNYSVETLLTSRPESPPSSSKGPRADQIGYPPNSPKYPQLAST